jgi:hypothetical protein
MVWLEESHGADGAPQDVVILEWQRRGFDGERIGRRLLQRSWRRRARRGDALPGRLSRRGGGWNGNRDFLKRQIQQFWRR